MFNRAKQRAASNFQKGVFGSLEDELSAIFCEAHDLDSQEWQLPLISG
ncbi:hypothetical protein RBSH_05491 [Rhodopirellula baltica SH28]|uniref:Uncharacterized protein n=1 Tax=Rhodopirellula baltica SH28 TaxID=993517 RepID=K5D8P8_RHOBT|nr:hypothetical protein RBSH_05491 [Rhodopirellula baltica SH28]